jgi:hypothetical protein
LANFQKLALSSGANAMGLGMGMGIGGMFPGLGGGMMSSMIPGGAPVAATSAASATKVISLSQVSILGHERCFARTVSVL